MLKTILTTIVGAGVDHPATQFALEQAQQTAALLVGLGIIDEAEVHPREPVPMGGGAAKVALDAHRLALAQRAAEQSLSAFALRCAQAQVACKLLEHVGMPAALIAEESQRYDLIVLPRTTGGGERHGFSTDLWQLLHATPRPVVTVGPMTGAGQSVVVAYDGSVQAARALQLYVESGLMADRQCHVASLAPNKLNAACTGQRAMDFLGHHQRPAQLHALEQHGNAGHALVQLALQLNAALLVMGACGQPTLREFFLGSVTKTALAECPIPLFLYH